MGAAYLECASGGEDEESRQPCVQTSLSMHADFVLNGAVVERGVPRLRLPCHQEHVKRRMVTLYMTESLM